MVLALSAQFAAAGEPIFETDAHFTASQAARGEGLAAFKAGDAVTALAKLEQALALRPNNSLLLGYVAFLSAETGDLARAAVTAKRYAAIGQAPGAGIQGKLAETLPTDVWAPIKAAFDANLAAKGSADALYHIPTDIALIEGIAAAPDGRLFVSAVVSGGLYLLEETGPRQIVRAADHGMGSFFGIVYDTHTNMLLATYGRVEQTPGIAAGKGITGVAAFDPDSGALMYNWTLDGSSADHQIADIIVRKSGEIYASDSTGKAIYKISGETLVKAFDLPASTSPQGMAETPAGQLILADYGRGLWLLDPATGAVALLGLPAGVNLVGLDGLTSHGDDLIAVQNAVNPQRLMTIKISADGKSVISADVLAQSLPEFDEPTLGVSTPGGYVFVANSQWPKYGPGGTVRKGATVHPTVILRRR